jgi:hypothetical protein
MMDDVSSENAASTTSRQHHSLQQQQQLNSTASTTMYRPAAMATTPMGWMATGIKVLPKHYTACEYADLVELIGTSSPLPWAMGHPQKGIC